MDTLNSLPVEFSPASAWQVRLSSIKSMGKPCVVCGSNFIHVPFEVVTASGLVVCFRCCHQWNRLLATVIELYQDQIHKGYGEFTVSETPVHFMFGYGSDQEGTQGEV
jgi:hypothetical protein